MKKLLRFLSAIATFSLLCSIAPYGQSDAAILDGSASRLRGVIERFSQDVGAFNRLYTARTSGNRAERFRQLYAEYLAGLEKLNFDSLNHDEQVDYLLFANHLRRETRELDRERVQFAEMAALLPFAKVINDLEDQRRRLESIDPAKTAALLDDLAKSIVAAEKRGLADKSVRVPRTVANRAVRTLGSLRQTLRGWYGFHNLYDPMFTWWNKKPYEAVDDALNKYTAYVTTKLVGISADDKTTIIGDPIGREALIEELQFEMIPYTPEELVEIANKEFDWCIAEFKKVSREMGYGDDYMKAIEAVKQKYVEPGRQPGLIRDFAREAIEYVKKNDLVTVPKVAEETWRMEMMTPERQLVAPFFLGGETILVSYPTDGMTHEQKMMSMRGNNPHFARAVTHHELIPGHHLQQFMTSRYKPYRRIFSTPFWGEGWALYWEFLLWDRGFVKTPEDKIGALFWRSHRAARIIFSLNFHLGNWTPEQCVDLLVNKVGHERENALAEVRRSFAGDYGPLYQMAYMMGGLQFYALHRDVVRIADKSVRVPNADKSVRVPNADKRVRVQMTDRDFHDAILKEGSIPVEMVRAILTNQKLSKDHTPKWRYYSGSVH
ncbi:MAG: DUF885 family protein [Pyrinomonadaceae bacterium]